MLGIISLSCFNILQVILLLLMKESEEKSMKWMKKVSMSVCILIILNLSIFFVDGSFQSNNMSVLDDSASLDMTEPYFDVEKEIQPIDSNFQNSPQIQFNPSPIIENNISSDLSFSIKNQVEPLVVNIDLEKQVLSTNEQLNFIIQATRDLEPAIGEVLTLEIIEGEYFGWYYSWYRDGSHYQDRIIETRPITIGTNGEHQGHFTSSTSGRYTFIVRSSEGDVQETRSFTIADIGLFWRVSREFVYGESHSSVAYVLNTTDFSPVFDAKVNLSLVTSEYNSTTHEYDSQAVEIFNGASNSQGIVDIDFIPPDDLSNSYNVVANLSATYNSQTIYISRSIYRGGYYWGWDGSTEHQPYEFIVTTDKPIYLPGETIQTRILIWENNYLKVTKEPVQTTFSMKILSPSQHTLVQKQLETNSYGVTSYSFSLDFDTELGQYSIVTQKEDVMSSITIRVDKYEKPAFRVDIVLDQEYVSPGKIVSGTIKAEYYFGKPVSESEVNIYISTFGVITDKTDTNGFLEFKYRLPGVSYFEGEYGHSITINVSVTDTVGREVTTSCEVQTSDQIYVWAYVNPWFPKVNENITVYFGAYQYSGFDWYWRNWRPIASASASIEIFAILSDDVSIPIASFESETDDNGQGQTQIEIPLIAIKYTSRFKGMIEIETKDGRKDSSYFYFTMNRNLVEASFNNNNNGLYQPGDTVEIDIAVKNAISNENIGKNVRFRVFDSDYDLIGQTDEFISRQGEKFNFRLSSQAPSGKYLIYIYLETIFDYNWGFRSYYRYSETLEFNVGSSYQLSLSSDKEKYSLMDDMVISGQITGKSNAPLMIQFVKKGIVTTEYIDISSSTSFEIQIDSIAIFAPRVWIFAFAILEDGTILDANLEIEIESSIFVEITSDKSIYEPGELANIQIKLYDSNYNPLSTVLAVSFIDSSVFGVEADPENELEHFDQKDYWPSVWTGVSWKNRQRDWWFWWYEDYVLLDSYWNVPRGGYLENTPGRDLVSLALFDEQTKTEGNNEEITTENSQEVRDNLPENAYWSPFIVVENGELEIDLELPDTIGEWTVRVVATTDSGLGVLEKYSFKTFLPFFVEIDKEPFVLQDDIFVIKGVVYNYLGEIIDLSLEIETASGILVLAKNTQNLRLPDGHLGSIGWACLAEDVGYFNITLYANTQLKNGTNYSDALRKSIEIIPNGINHDFKATGFISSNPSFSYERYSDSVKKKEFLELSLGLGSIAINSLDRLIGYPYGCTEQTISRLIPNALVLKYLELTGQLTNETREVISDMIISGLSRIYNQRNSDGGWGWWSSESSRAYMTGLVLYGLGIVNNSGFYIEPSIISNALTLLSTMQNPDGSWTPDSWRGIDQVSFTASVLRSVLSWENLLYSNTTITESISYIMTAWNSVLNRSTYLAGMYLDTVPGSGYGSSGFETTLLSYLQDEVEISTYGYYWSYSSEDYPWWRALGGDVEITALALKAFVENNPSASVPIIRGAIQWLLHRQSRYGWGNTADTAAAITTFIALSNNSISSDADTNVTLYINEIELGNYSLSTSSQSTIYLDLTDNLTEGDNNISFTKYGLGNVSYYFSSNQILRSLPTIDLPGEITASPEQQIILPLTISPSSSYVFASQITITPLKGGISPIVDLPQTIDQLTQQIIINFVYNAPSDEGTYDITGFEISYRLSDENQTKFSPGNIVRTYGPIKLMVLTNSFPVNSVTHSNLYPSFTSHLSTKTYLADSYSSITVDRKYSQLSHFKKGDLITVTLTVTSDQIENFLMLEDFIPAGFELDESTIHHSTGSYVKTGNGITFFYPELDIGTTEVKYGIIAMNIRQSIAAPAKLSCMYDEWVEMSEPAILGESRIPIDPVTGLVKKDLQIPVLNSLNVEETATLSDYILEIEVTASDNWGIASIRVFIKQKTIWNSFECFEDEDSWTTQVTGLDEGNSVIFVEIIDQAGNTVISDETVKYLEFRDLFIPILPIVGLLGLAAAIGIISSMYVRKRYI